MKKKYEFGTKECEHEWSAPYIGWIYGYSMAACWDCIKCGHQHAIELNSPEYEDIHVEVCDFCGLPREGKDNGSKSRPIYDAYCECIVEED